MARMIVSEINELRKLLVDFKEGTVSREDLDAQVSIYKQTNRRVQNTLKVMSLMVKVGMKREVKKLLNQNLIGELDEITTPLPLYDCTKDRGNDE